jgi:hypothetical protein
MSDFTRARNSNRCVCGHTREDHITKTPHRCAEDHATKPGHRCSCTGFQLPIGNGSVPDSIAARFERDPVISNVADREFQRVLGSIPRSGGGFELS